MDYDVLRETLKVTLDEVAFKSDPADPTKNISILGRAQEDLKTFLEENTSISDDEKAKRYSEFLTNIITSVTTQAIMVAGEAPFRDAQAKTLEAETAQKILSMVINDTNQTNESVQKVISMQNDDKAKLNNSAVNVAEAKAKIETLMPAQIQQITADIAHKVAQTALEGKKIEIAEKDIELKIQEIPLRVAQVAIEEKKIDLMDKQLLSEDKKITIMEKEIAIKEQELPLKIAQAEVEQKKLLIMDKDILIKGEEILIKKEQALSERQKVQLMIAQTEIERAKMGLTQQQIRVSAMEVEYKMAQIMAIQQASIVNKEIEEAKNRTQKEVAEIYSIR